MFTKLFSRIGPLALAALALIAPISAPAQVTAPAQPRPTPPPARKYALPVEPHVYETFDQKIRVSVMVHGIGRPWSLLPLPDGNFLVGVRPIGQVLAIRDGVLDPTPLTGLPAMHTSFRTGMLDMVMHPKYSENKWIYFTYSSLFEAPPSRLAFDRRIIAAKD